MLRLMQVIHYMIVTLEYTETEVTECMKSIQYSATPYDEFRNLLDVLNIETNVTMDELATKKIVAGRWSSALYVTRMKIA